MTLRKPIRYSSSERIRRRCGAKWDSMELTTTLLGIHILAGVTALGGAIVAIVTKSLDMTHRWHVYGGRVFFWSAATIFVTAIPLALVKSNLFLLLVAVLSFYVAFAGWRYATHRAGTPRAIDWGSAGAMAVGAVLMFPLGVYLVRIGNLNGITMIVFGIAGGVLCTLDFLALKRGGAKGLARIAQHMTMMLAGTTAIVTAFVVTNFKMQPSYVPWIAPTLIATPIILYWMVRIRAGRRPVGAPES
jgi:hypothetical protein